MSRLANADYAHLGAEPVWEPKDSTLTDSKIKEKFLASCAWYNYFHDQKQSREWLYDFVTANNDFDTEMVDCLKVLDDYDLPSTLGWVARMLENGAPLTVKIIESFNKRLEKGFLKGVDLSHTKKKKAKNIEGPKLSIQERVLLKAESVIGDFEDAFETFLLSNCTGTSFKAYKYFESNSISGVVAGKLIDPFTQMKDVYDKVLKARLTIDADKTSEEVDLVEGYSHLKHREVKKIIKFFSDIVDDCTKWNDNKKTDRKPRKKKTVSLDKKIKNVLYLKDHSDLKMKSVNPTKLIGAKRVMLYDTKTNLFSVYTSDCGMELNRTVLLNYDESKSLAKKVRNSMIGDLSKGAPRSVMKRLKDHSTKEQELTGRINRNTIILKAE